MDLRNQFVKSVKWASFSKFIRLSLQYVTLLVLAYFLAPKDFGLMSTAMIYIGFFNLIKDLGFASAIIRIEKESNTLYSSIFWINLFVGIFLSILIFLLSDVIAKYYKINDLRFIIRVLSFSFFFSSLTGLPNSILEKNMRFNILAGIEVIATFLASGTAIILAILEYGVWSLVLQNIVFVSITFCATWLAADFLPSFSYDKNEIKKVLGFGIHLSGFNILNYLVRNADYFLIGKFLGMQSLGYYSLAYRIMLFPIQNITSVINRVLYPILAKVKDDNTRTQKIYLSVSKSVAFFTFPIMLTFFVVNNNFVTIFLSEKWQPIIPVLYVLVPIGMLQSVYTLAGVLFLIKDKTQLWFYWGIFSAIITLLGFYIGLKWNILGVAIGYLISNLILMFPGSYIAFNLIKLKVQSFLKNLSRTFAISMTTAFLTFLLKIVINDINSYYSFFLLISFSLTAYFLLSYKFNKNLFSKLIRQIKF